MIIKEL